MSRADELRREIAKLKKLKSKEKKIDDILNFEELIQKKEEDLALEEKPKSKDGTKRKIYRESLMSSESSHMKTKSSEVTAKITQIELLIASNAYIEARDRATHLLMSDAYKYIDDNGKFRLEKCLKILSQQEDAIERLKKIKAENDKLRSEIAKISRSGTSVGCEEKLIAVLSYLFVQDPSFIPKSLSRYIERLVEEEKRDNHSFNENDTENIKYLLQLDINEMIRIIDWRFFSST